MESGSCPDQHTGRLGLPLGSLIKPIHNNSLIGWLSRIGRKPTCVVIPDQADILETRRKAGRNTMPESANQVPEKRQENDGRTENEWRNGYLYQKASRGAGLSLLTFVATGNWSCCPMLTAIARGKDVIYTLLCAIDFNPRGRRF